MIKYAVIQSRADVYLGENNVKLDDIRAGVTLSQSWRFGDDIGVFDTLDEAITELKKYKSSFEFYSNIKFEIEEYMIEERDYYDDEDDEEYEVIGHYDHFSEMMFGVYDEDTYELIGCSDNLGEATRILKDYETEDDEDDEDEERYAYIELL